jgi:hypothetical protein
VSTAAIADPATTNAAFNADAERYKNLESGDLALPDDAPFTAAEVENATQKMSEDDWERYILKLCAHGHINDRQLEKLRDRIFHGDRNVRSHARFMALKYAPDKVRELLTKPAPLPKKRPKIEIPKSCFAEQPAS